MRLSPSDPDIQTLIFRMRDGVIDLQPDFQRGEIWSTTKKQRLIDSILRDWHIPPIHLIIDDKSSRQLVLDGQQRLAAIRDFSDGVISIDGFIEPYNEALVEIHGCHYDDLPTYWKEKFNQFTIRVFRITDYQPSEPGELFYRLNQLSSLTPAEQRNAFFGEARFQIKSIVQHMITLGLDEYFWGFSNARMAYDDIIARSCFALEQGSLKKRVSSLSLADKYRSGEPFSSDAIEKIESALLHLSKILPYLHYKFRLNKANSQSWLIFLATASSYSFQKFLIPEILARFYTEFNTRINQIKHQQYNEGMFFFEKNNSWQLPELFYQVFSDRSTSRVADTNSVILRDFILWTAFYKFLLTQNQIVYPEGPLGHLHYNFNENQFSTIQDLEEFVTYSGWGDKL